jgi:hypothetical protein
MKKKALHSWCGKLFKHVSKTLTRGISGSCSSFCKRLFPFIPVPPQKRGEKAKLKMEKIKILGA